MAYIQQAHRAWDVAWEILHDDRGWTVKKGRDLKTGLVMSKSYKNLGLVHKLEVYLYGIPTHGCYDTLARHRWTREFGHGRFAFM